MDECATKHSFGSSTGIFILSPLLKLFLDAFLLIAELQFTLQSTGYLDRRGLTLNQMKSYIKYGKEKIWPILGFNFMVIDHSNGDVYSKRSFNTQDFSVASVRMIKYLSELPRSMIVLGVILSHWKRHVTPKLIQILVRFFLSKKLLHMRRHISSDTLLANIISSPYVSFKMYFSCNPLQLMWLVSHSPFI